MVADKTELCGAHANFTCAWGKCYLCMGKMSLCGGQANVTLWCTRKTLLCGALGETVKFS